MKSLWAILFIFLFSLSSSAQFNCDELLDDCEFYSCVEEEKHCGKRGYMMAFGKKYCMKFQTEIDRFSENGKVWVSNVRLCLIDKMNNTDETLSCKKFKKAQVKSHLPCYVESGYCSLSGKDKRSINKVILKSLWKPSLIFAGLRVLGSCLGNHL
ncbi:hypothetical protein A9Q84_01425 [Halobacteriovorax marinus]|uniref:Lipoprotein n=1 Tax=Halobacteriovorax marinus TaxID=97084 RepID=A0A1Y5FBY7_9BACT|nr:hypothetical protein A9Q84_01425 [Halobacteriovorax marinus]